MDENRHGSTLGGCFRLVLGNIGSSIVGGVAGLLIGIELARGKDAILPVSQLLGLVVGLVAGPMLLAVVRYFKRQ